MTKRYLADLDSYQADLIRRRRYLHQHPELSFQEQETAQYIRAELAGMEHFAVSQPTETSVLAILKGGKPGKRIGLRADLDALPIQEQRPEYDYQSTNPGVMHACGHDGHTAMLLTACQWLNDHVDQVPGEIYCVFQHAEEVPPGGAQEIMDTGVLDGLDFMYGQHLSTDLPTGQIGLTPGSATSNTDQYELTIKGFGGHSSTPHELVNPIDIVADLLQAFKSLPSQLVHPQDTLVIANTYVESGDPVSLNIVPASLRLGGCVRSFSDEDADRVDQALHDRIHHICAYYGADYEYKFVKGAPSVINNSELTDFTSQNFEEIFPGQIIHPPAIMGGEDFAVFSREIPSCFAWLGTRNDEKDNVYPHHHEKFTIDEDSLLIGVKMLVTVAMEYPIKEAL